MSRVRNTGLINAFRLVLKQQRLRLGLTQEALAFRADVDRTFVGLLETGRRQPSLSVIYSLAAALETTPEELLVEVNAAMKG